MRYLILFVCSFLCSAPLFAQEVKVVDDFNAKTIPVNSLKKETGDWSTEPKESGKGCKLSFGLDVSGYNPDGASLRIAYDVRTQNRDRQPMCGYWTRLNLDLSKMKFLKMSVKGETDYGYPRNLIIELKDKDYKTGKYTIEGISGKWQEFVVPMGAFRDVRDWKNIIELGLLFHESMGRDHGALLIDNIMFLGDATGSSGSKFTSVSAKDKVTLESGGWKRRQLVMAALDGKKHLEYGEVKDSKDLSAEIYSQWDADYLYFLADIRDDELVVVEDSDQAQEGDGLTCYFDKLGDGFLTDGEDDIAVLLLPNGALKILNEGREPTKDEVRFSVMPSRGKYIIVAAFSWKYLDIKPEKNKDLAVSFAVQDLDISPSTKKGRINWAYTPVSGAIELGRMNLK